MQRRTKTKGKSLAKGAAALLLASSLAVGGACALFQGRGQAAGWGNEISPAERRASGPYQHQIRQAQASYRNLNLTPGATVHEMRWTWHSRSETGAIRIYPAGSDTPIDLGGAAVHSRPLGYGIDSAIGVTDANPLGAGGLAPGAQPRAAAPEGATGVQSYPWFTAEEGTAGDYWVHQVSVSSLSAGASYEYVITGSIGGSAFTSARKPFRTGPGRNTGFTFTAGGDPQIGIGDFTPGREAHPNNIPNPGIGFKSHVEDYYGWVNAVTVMAAHAPNAGFFLAVGDQIDTNDGSFRRSQFMHDILFAPSALHSLPLLPVVGNHEANNNGWLWHQHYNTPVSHPTSAAPASNVRAHGPNPWQIDYYLIWGNMLLIQLDGNTRNWAGGRLAWFEEIIAAHQPAAEWTVVTFHQPPYSVFRATNLGEKQQIIANWLPEFERLGVDVVLNGHCHVFSRTHHMAQNAPVLTQNWVQPDGTVVTGTTPTSVVYNPAGIVYFAFNSMSGSGFRNVRNMGGRNYISVYNQNFRRNFSVIDVTNYSFAVHTYQINDDGSSVQLVDTYTLVRGGFLSQAMAADPRSLRQNTCPVQGVNTDIIRVAIVPDLAMRADAVITAADLGLPATIEIETAFSNNQRAQDALGILGARALRDELNSYDFRVRPMRVAVNWDLSGIPATAAGRTGQSFTVTGALDLSYIMGTAQTVPLPAPVAADATFTDQAGVTHPCPYQGRHVNFQGTPDLIMHWRHGTLTNPDGLTATARISFGARPLSAPFRVSQFGASAFHYTARTAADFLYAAFDRNAFESWPAVRSGTGFGYFADRYDEVPMLITSTPPTIPPPGLQYRGAMGAGALANMGTIQYSPAGYAANATFHYFSRVFDLPANFNPANVGEVSGAHRIAGNLILFVNGVEVYRFNTSSGLVQIAGGVDWGGFNGNPSLARNRYFNINSDFAMRDAGVSRSGQEGDPNVFDAASRANLISALRPGENVLTAVVGDTASDSMSLWFDLDLTIGYQGHL